MCISGCALVVRGISGWGVLEEDVLLVDESVCVRGVVG